MSLNMTHESEDEEIGIDVAYEQINAFQFSKERKRMFGNEEIYESGESPRSKYRRTKDSTSPVSDNQKSPETEEEPPNNEEEVRNAVLKWITPTKSSQTPAQANAAIKARQDRNRLQTIQEGPFEASMD